MEPIKVKFSEGEYDGEIGELISIDWSEEECKVSINGKIVCVWVGEVEKLDGTSILRLKDLPQYHLDRDIFIKIVEETIGCSKLFDAFNYDEFNQTYNFAWYRDELNEFYITHKSSGMTVNWYKHLGRTNSCSQEGRTEEDYREFFIRFNEDLDEWAKIHNYNLDK